MYLNFGLYVSTRDHGSVGYRVPREWGEVPEGWRGGGSLGALKRASRAAFLGGYAAFRCRDRGCRVCRGVAG